MNVIPYARGKKRPRTKAMPRMRVARSLKYNGENRITRTVNYTLPYAGSGISILSLQTEAINIVFDPQNITFWNSAINFETAPIVNAAEYIALYDRLRIDKVEMTWAVNTQAQSVIGSTGSSPPRFLVCNDENDGQSAATLAEIQQQPNKAFYSSDGSQMKWTCVPKYSRIVYQTNLVSNYEPARGFVNSNSLIPHYGIRMGITNTANPTYFGKIDFSFKVFLSLKNDK